MKIPNGISCSIVDLKLDKLDNINIFNTRLCTHLQKTKEKIDDSAEEWDQMKKIANPYELIHSSNIKEKKERSIAKYKPT